MLLLRSLSLSALVACVHGTGLHGAGVLGERTLKAAVLHSDLAKRTNEIPLRHQLELHYVEDASSTSEAMGAKMELQGNVHTILLEDIDHLLEEVHCEGGMLEIKFQSHHYKPAMSTLESSEELLIITSHYGCNDHGSRLPYRVLERYYSEVSSSATFKLGLASWKKDYNLNVRFGPESTKKYSLNRHSHLRRHHVERSLPAAIESVIPGKPAVSVTSIVPSSSQIVFPTPTETGKLQATSIVNDISRSFQNAQIFPPKVAGVTVSGTHGQLTNTHVTITCVDCSTTGKIGLASGYFSANESGAADFIHDGFVSVNVNDLTASLALEAIWTASETYPFNISLPQIPLTPFAIPGVANVGITFTPHLTMAASLTADLQFNYGFKVTVPNNSSFVANFGSPTNSTATGFENTSITALPFSANLADVELKFSITLQPEISVGVVLLDEQLGAAFFLNMPQLAAGVGIVNGTDQNCAPFTASENSSEQAQIVDSLGPLVHLVPQIDLAAGFVLQAGDVFQTAWTPLATQLPMATGCFAVEPTGNSRRFVEATAAFASASKASASVASASMASASMASASKASKAALAKATSSSAAGNLGREGGENIGGLRWRAAVVALGVVSGTFLVL